MRSRPAVVLTALALWPLAACSTGPNTTDELTYQIEESLTALVIGARAASVDIVVGDGPLTVTEEHRYSRTKPTTAHLVQGQTLQLTETGCGDDDDLRCDVGYRIRMPKTMSTQITAQAGAIKVDGLEGNVHITTHAGAVDGQNLTSAEVTVKTEAGAASLTFTKPPTLVQATTSMGAVEVHLPDTTAYAVDVQTSIGPSSISVDQDPASTHRIQVHTELGAVKIQPFP
jgi:hypothetical protein